MCLRAIVTILKIQIHTINKNIKQTQHKNLDDKVETFQKLFKRKIIPKGNQPQEIFTIEEFKLYDPYIFTKPL